MRKTLAFLLGALLCWPAWAQQVPNPAPMDTVIGWVGTNAALKARAYKLHPVYRAGFTVAGDGGGATYVHSTTACTLNGGNGDDGSQVKDNAAGCWNIAPAGAVDLRVFGAKPSDGSIDAGPAIRAAALYSELNGATISVPAGLFYLNTLDPEGTGAIVFGKSDRNVPAPGYPLPTFKTMPNFVGQTWHNDPNMCFITEPAFFLGNGLNRPLVHIKSNSVSSRLENLCLSGNRSNQSGWAGGPGGKLFTIVAEATANAQPSSSLTAKNVAIRDGLDGNLFYGSGRGVLYLTDAWSLYSGRTITDIGVYLASYDAIIYNLQAGYSSGYGVYLATGQNYTFTAGGSFSNTSAGMYVAGSVADLQIYGMRMQANKREGIVIGAEAPNPGQQISGRTYVGMAFNDNSAEGNGLYDDISMPGNAVFHDTFVGPAFQGSQNPAGPKPRHNVGVGFGVRVTVNGAMPSPAANVSGFTNDFTGVVGDYQYVGSWVPHFWGATSGGAGTETPSAGGWPKGHWSRAGKVATVTGNIKLDAFTATGDIVVGDYPLISKTGTFSSCTLGRVSGFNPPAGYTMLSMMIGETSTVASLFKSGPLLAGVPVAPTDFTVPMELAFTCTYPIIDGG